MSIEGNSGAMSTHGVDLDTIYKSLRLVPDFDGNPHVLTRFINICDQLVVTYFKPVQGYELSNLALINGILNKVTGPAARHINSNGIPDTWNGIRSALINNFADHRDETALYSDLSLQTQGSSTPQEFYERCQNLFSTIMTYISLHETVNTTIEAKRTLYKKLTLQAYLRGLKDPLGARIRCMRPESMEKALEYVQDELNTLYLQNRNEGGPSTSRKDWSQSLPHTNHQFHLPLNNFNPKISSYNAPAMPGPSKPYTFNMPGPQRQQSMQPYAQGWRPSMPMQQQPRGLTRTQQMMRAPLPNYHPQSNVFRMPPRAQPQPPSNFTSAPKPMSGVSPFVPKTLPPSGRDWRQFGNPPPSNYFKTREVNLNEFDYDYDYNNCYYVDFDQECYYTNEQYPEPGYYEDPYYAQDTPVVEEVDRDAAPTENFQKVSQLEKPK